MDNKKLVNSNFKGVSITAHSGDSLTQKEQLGRGGQILGRVNLPSGQIISSSRTDFIKKVTDRFEAILKANKVRATKTGRK